MTMDSTLLICCFTAGHIPNNITVCEYRDSDPNRILVKVKIPSVAAYNNLLTPQEKGLELWGIP